MNAIANILAARLLILLSCIGGFVLAVVAGDILRFEVFVAYCVLLILPLVVLDILTRRR